MQSISRAATAAMLAVTTISGSTAVAAADATKDREINGTYLATSNGEWARTNDSYHDEATIRSTWTITSSCIDPQTCRGTVTSDQGWTAELTNIGPTWYVRRDLPNWEQCGDGTAATGRQTFRFYPWDNVNSIIQEGSPVLVGEDETIGPSGACGQSHWLSIRMPFKLVKIG